MEYIIRHCPKCNGELHIPNDLKSCICMFCGETFDVKETQFNVMPESLQQVETDYKAILNKIPDLITKYELYMDKFKRNSYTDSFEEYVKLGSAILLPAERFSSLSDENKEIVLDELMHAFNNAMNKNIDENTKGGLNKLNKNVVLDQCRFFQAVYVVPMIRSLNYSFSEPLTNHIVEQWNKEHSKFPFQKAGYDEIQKGFDKKPFCFITTAVCEKMDKEDDCYELTAFRSFRDTYMLQSVEGRKLVNEYYQIAPAIVTFINMQPDCNNRYRDIWQRYLKPCLKDIEDNQLEECEIRYSGMVRALKEEYHIR